MDFHLLLSKTGRRLVSAAGVVFVVGSVSIGDARAAITHTYLPLVSKAVSEGAPPASGAALGGPLEEVTAMTGDGGHLWAAELVESAGNATRVNEYDAETGAFMAQLNAEGGVSSLTDGVAVGHATGEEEVYVGAGNSSGHVVAVYDSAHKLQGVWSGAHTANGSFSGEGSGQTLGIGVDGSGSITDPAAGDVYVLTAQTAVGSVAFNVVDVFAPSAGGQEPVQAAAEIRGTCETVGPCAGSEVVPFVAPRGVTVSGFNGDVLVTDGASDACTEGTGKCVVDVFEPVSGMPGVYSYLFKITGSPSTGAFKHPGPVAVNIQNGNIYVVEMVSGVVDEYSPNGQYLGALHGTPTGAGGEQQPFTELRAVAVDPVTGNVFVANHSGESEKLAEIMDAFGPDLVIPDVAVIEPPASVGPHGATLRGSLNPDGAGEAQCEFEYGTSTSYGQHVACGAAGAPVPPGGAPVPNGNEPVGVESASVTGLSPDTTYFYRLVASNHNGSDLGECPQDCGQFTTTGPGISGVSVVNVSSTAATVQAEVNPDGGATSYYVQYSLADTGGCEAEPSACVESPASPGIALGSANAEFPVSRHLQGLAPSTVYHYRVVAVSAVGGGPAQAFASADRSFSTERVGSALTLPDGRHWELVSPPDKQGALLLPIQEVGLLQAAVSGNAISYRASAPTEAGAQGYSETEQIFSSRGAGGWASQDISQPHSGAVGSSVGEGSEYRLFSEDLGSAVIAPNGPFTSLAPETSLPDTETTPYVRHNATCRDTPSTCYRPLLVGCPSSPQRCPAPVEESADVPAGTKFGVLPDLSHPVAVQGANEDLSVVVVSSRIALASPPKAGEEAVQYLYEWTAARPAPQALQPVSIRPDGTLAPGRSGLGTENVFARGAVSTDGSRVVWSEVRGHLYMRDMTAGKTVQLDAPQAACLAAETCGQGEVSPTFQFASADGSRVFFTDKQRLTADSGEIPAKADLYVCEISLDAEGVPVCSLSDLTAAAPGSVTAADVQRQVLGASSDGSTVYFVANGALSPGASQGTCEGNKSSLGATCTLYVEHFDGSAWSAPKLVAVLGGDDVSDWAGVPGAGLGVMTARVSSNGRFVAFMSDRSLTGYDNRDAVTGRPDEEVFLYDALGNGGAGQMVCASCDPTGARPVGVEYSQLAEGLTGVQSGGTWSNDQGIAADVPAWTAFTLREARHQARYLSPDGRLFFDSVDALVPQDVNNNQDVYEFEPAGVGDCTAASPGFSAVTGGCVGLISSGTAAGESGFLDAGESGDDVFFLTVGRLVGADVDTALDVYDAHVCSSAAPCFSEVQSPPPCTTADACRAPVSEQPGIFGAPASATFSGAGNISPSSGSPAVSARSSTRARKLTKALVACREKYKHSKKRRVVCERQARKLYRAKPARNSARGNG
jgi:hypothetical protein